MTSYYDWSGAEQEWKDAAVFPVIPEELGIHPLLLATLKLPLGQSVEIFQSAVFALYRNVMAAMLVPS